MSKTKSPLQNNFSKGTSVKVNTLRRNLEDIAQLVSDPATLMEDFPREKKLNLFVDDTGKGSISLTAYLETEQWHNSDQISVLWRARAPHTNVTENAYTVQARLP